MSESNRVMLQITRTSIFTNKTQTKDMFIDPVDLAHWENGTLIQNAMPYLTPDEREFLMTGCDKAEWDAIFGG